MVAVLIVLIVAAALCGLWLFMIAPARRRPAALKTLLEYRYAHRGFHSIKYGIPENSIPAFRLAMEQGFGMELDVHLSADGKLVVEHDDHLRRTCASPLIIEDCTWEQLQSLRLEQTQERLPLLEEVFALVEGRVPLLIELKAYKGNQAALAEAVWKALQSYEGPYCIESFDPRCIGWFRRNAPEVPRGQLASHLRRGKKKHSILLHFALSNLLVNAISRPHFIAYCLRDRKNLSFRICRSLFGAPAFFWTTRSLSEEQTALALGAAPIFERKEDELFKKLSK